MPQHKPKQPIPLLRSIATGWLAGVLSLAVWITLLPQGQMEIGWLGTLIWLGTVGSVIYLFDTVLIFLMPHALDIFYPRATAIHCAIAGSLLFAVSVPIWIWVIAGPPLNCYVPFMLMGAIAGAASFFEYRRLVLLMPSNHRIERALEK